MHRDFYGFSFGNYHSSDFGLYAVSSGNRYEKNLLPAPSDTTSELAGADGTYYFGQIYKNRELKINVAFDSIKESTWRKMAQVFASDKLQDLIFDENPYKVYRAKLKSKPDFKFVCFKDSENGERIYKGEGTLTFVCYHPYAFCFNKYVVRAADFYKCMQPQDIINCNSIEVNPYKNPAKPKMLTGLIKDHYNVKPNMAMPWKGGYPSIEQVQWGELYYNESHENGCSQDCSDEEATEKGLIVDVRHYWDNIPRWQGTAKLLVSPTLDYDRNLIYMPQYSQTNYYNMDTGLNRQNGLIGSRILVYNPGDIPVSFELRLGNIVQKFRNSSEPTTFRISRYNVQRLTIEQAVDWTELKTYNPDDNKDYKYGSRYVGISEKRSAASSAEPDFLNVRHLNNSHPEVLYYAEPIPKKKLGDFIRLFYWQSQKVVENDSSFSSLKSQLLSVLDLEAGKEFANRYEECLELCITEEEENELYWDTLYRLFKVYDDVDKCLRQSALYTPIFSNNYSFEDFYYDFLQHPMEYLRDDGLDYGEFNFNIYTMPQYMTEDYMEISTKNFEKIKASVTSNDLDRTLPLFLDFERHLLYNINESEDFYDFKPTKSSWNDNIVKGKWFMLPPGWSLIDISPVSNNDIWGGKRWLDARPFYWGTTSQDKRNEFDKYEKLAIIDYVSKASPISNLHRDLTIQTDNPLRPAGLHPITAESTAAERKEAIISSNFELDDLEDLIQFRRWYEEDPSFSYYTNLEPDYASYRNTIRGLGYEIWKTKVEQTEYGFLKTLAEYWRVHHTDANGLPDPNHDIDEFWWYASNYLIINFPPLYWGYIDLLNKLQIKYVPQFY